MPKVICVAGHKGGTGKTVTAVNLAACLAVYEFNTLLIDLDPAGFASVCLHDERVVPERTLADALEAGTISDDHVHRSHLDLLHIIPADRGLDRVPHHHAALQDAALQEDDFILRSMIRRNLDRFDYIVLDTPPRPDWLTLNALAAADHVIVPLPPQVFVLNGLGRFLMDIEEFRRRMNPVPGLVGVVLIQGSGAVAADLSLCRDVLKPAAPFFFRTSIPRDGLLREVGHQGAPLLLSAISSPASMAYMELTREVVALRNENAEKRMEGPQSRVGMNVDDRMMESRRAYGRMAASLAETMETINKT